MVARRRMQPEIQRVERTLPCELTPDELRAHGDEAARLDEEIFNEQERAAAHSKASKALVSELQHKRTDKLRRVRTRREDRTVACEIVWDFAENAVRTIRLDTGEEIQSRAMTYEERQGRLFEIPAGANTVETERQRTDLDRFRDEMAAEESEADLDEASEES